MVEDQAILLLVKWLAYFDGTIDVDGNIRHQLLGETMALATEKMGDRQKTIDLMAKIKQDYVDPTK